MPKFRENILKTGHYKPPLEGRSKKNYLLLKVQKPQEIIEGLKSRGILVRPKPAPDGKTAVRVTIGTLKDIGRFIKVFSELLSKH